MQRLSIQRDVGGWNLRELKSKDPSWTHLTKKLANGTHSSLSISLCRLEEFIYLFTYWSVPIYIIYLIVTGWHPPRLQKAPRIPSHFRIIFKDRRVDGPVRPSWKFQSWHLEMGRWSKVCKPPPRYMLSLEMFEKFQGKRLDSFVLPESARSSLVVSKFDKCWQLFEVSWHVHTKAFRMRMTLPSLERKSNIILRWVNKGWDWGEFFSWSCTTPSSGLTIPVPWKCFFT